MTTHYYHARRVSSGYVAQLYHYDVTGNHKVKVWESDEVFDKKEEAEDAAVEKADDMGIDAELD